MALPLPHRFRSTTDLLRIVASAIMMAHGAARIYYRTVDEFGMFLTSQGFPAGLVLAWFVTGAEVIAGGILLLGYFRRIIAPWFFLELLVGVLLVHAKHGLFVVGHGTGGVEFSILLMAAMTAVTLSGKD